MKRFSNQELALGIHGLGFHITPLPSGPRSWLLQAYIRWLNTLYGPRRLPKARPRTGGHRVGLIWLTRHELSRAIEESRPASHE